ncbi:MAG: hypothetical protein FD135_1278, partial [Comamonadaceae bacterium]
MLENPLCPDVGIDIETNVETDVEPGKSPLPAKTVKADEPDEP